MFFKSHGKHILRRGEKYINTKNTKTKTNKNNNTYILIYIYSVKMSKNYRFR